MATTVYCRKHERFKCWYEHAESLADPTFLRIDSSVFFKLFISPQNSFETVTSRWKVYRNAYREQLWDFAINLIKEQFLPISTWYQSTSLPGFPNFLSVAFWEHIYSSSRGGCRIISLEWGSITFNMSVTWLHIVSFWFLTLCKVTSVAGFMAFVMRCE